jgi:hypothetical protein
LDSNFLIFKRGAENISINRGTFGGVFKLDQPLAPLVQLLIMRPLLFQQCGMNLAHAERLPLIHEDRMNAIMKCAQLPVTYSKYNTFMEGRQRGASFAGMEGKDQVGSTC